MSHVIITQDGEDAKFMCIQLAATYAKWGLKINFRKTEYLTNDPDELYIGEFGEYGHVGNMGKIKY